MKRMLVNLQAISKQYDSRKILDKFSYTFCDTGFYLLFGESGCGKTTLLNILSGMTEFEDGHISIAGKDFHTSVQWDQIRDIVGYVTQNSFFIDYLTIGEQLELTGCKKADISILLARFKLEEYEQKYPSQLSGGEKQRLSIVQALLQNKKILLLDEPTASLDEENKRLVFETLSMVSRQILVICSSHDESAKRYADSIIEFTELDKIKPQTEHQSAANGICTDSVEQEKKHAVTLYPYYKKWFSYKGREKRSTVSIMIIYFVAFIALFLGDTPSHKLSQSIEHVYKINQCGVTVYDNGQQLFEVLDSAENMLDPVMIYNGSAPDITASGSSHDPVDYGVLPSDPNAFALKDHIAFGHYFDSADQIMLSANRAAEYGDPAELIGHTITLNMYDGYHSFEIAGIFEAFSDTDLQYLRQGLNLNGNDCIYLNSAYVQRFQNDVNFNWMGQRTYVIYFSDYTSMQVFQDDISALGFRVADSQIEYTILEQFSILFYFLLPFSLVIMLCSVLFYFQTKQMELAYNKHLLLMYDYLGFDKKEVKRCYIKGFFTENLRMLAVTFAAALILCCVINFLNEFFQIIAFRIFTFNPVLIALYSGFNILFSLSVSSLSYSKFKQSKWYELFMEERDLL